MYFIDNEFNTFNVEEFIKDRKEMLNRDTPPEDKCYLDIEEENGNRRLSSNCTYCKFKFKCWNNLRAFKCCDEACLRYNTFFVFIAN